MMIFVMMIVINYYSHHDHDNDGNNDGDFDDNDDNSYYDDVADWDIYLSTILKRERGEGSSVHYSYGH